MAARPPYISIFLLSVLLLLAVFPQHALMIVGVVGLSALPYHLGKPEKVLIIGAEGGADILQALFHTTKKVDAVELNPQMVELAAEKYSDFIGGLFNKENYVDDINTGKVF